MMLCWFRCFGLSEEEEPRLGLAGSEPGRAAEARPGPLGWAGPDTSVPCWAASAGSCSPCLDGEEVKRKGKGHLALKWWAPRPPGRTQAELSINRAVYWVSPAGLWGGKRMLNDPIRLQSNKKGRGNWQQFSEPVRWPVNLLPPALGQGRKNRNQKICRMEKKSDLPQTWSSC